MLAEHATDVAKAAPPTVVATLSFFGVSIPDVIQVLTLLYVAGLCAQMLYKFYGWLRARLNARGW